VLCLEISVGIGVVSAMRSLLNGTAGKDLHRQFGDTLTSHSARFPTRPAASRTGYPEPVRPLLLNPAEIVTELDSPAAVSSGHALRHSLLVRNLIGREPASGGTAAATGSASQPRRVRRGRAA
jgi:hypothetical protein